MDRERDGPTLTLARRAYAPALGKEQLRDDGKVEQVHRDKGRRDSPHRGLRSADDKRSRRGRDERKSDDKKEKKEKKEKKRIRKRKTVSALANDLDEALADVEGSQQKETAPPESFGRFSTERVAVWSPTCRITSTLWWGGTGPAVLRNIRVRMLAITLPRRREWPVLHFVSSSLHHARLLGNSCRNRAVHQVPSPRVRTVSVRLSRLLQFAGGLPSLSRQRTGNHAGKHSRHRH